MAIVHLNRFPLCDGPLVDFRAQRQGMVQRMAKDLVRLAIAANERDSIRALRGLGYPMADIIMLVDDARALAFQEIVTAEISQP